ncbi:hypothetical protein AUP68_15825 [Ilyonectria robusta]
MANNVYYLYYAPTWDWPPEDPIKLGNVLMSVKKPEQPLHTAPLPTVDEIFSSDKYERVETTHFVPKHDYIQKCIEAPAVRAHLERGRYRKPVYIVTGLKTVYGSKAKSHTSQPHGGNASVAFEGTGWSGGAVPLGVEGRHETTRGTSWQDSSDFAFAFRARKFHEESTADDECYDENGLMEGNRVVRFAVPKPEDSEQRL